MILFDWCWIRRSREKRVGRFQMPPWILKAEEWVQKRTQARADPSQRRVNPILERKKARSSAETAKRNGTSRKIARLLRSEAVENKIGIDQQMSP